MVAVRALAGMALVASLGAPGCFSPTGADCAVRCAGDRTCPGGMSCELATGLCRALDAPACDPSAAAPWWDQGWTHRIPIEVQAPWLGSELYDFPLLVRIHDPQLLAFAADADGADLRFVSGSTLLAHEIEVFDRDAGQLRAWVRLQSLGPAPHTVHLYLGNPTPTAPLPVTETWREDYLAVYHLAQGPDAPALDSTANAFHGAPTGALVGTDGGPLGPGLRFSPEDATRVTLPVELDPDGVPFTVEVWFSAAAPGDGTLVGTDVTDRDAGWSLSTTPSDARSLYDLELQAPRDAGKAEQLRAAEALEVERWYYAAGVFSLAGESALCLDGGRCSATDFQLASLFDNGMPVTIGADAGETVAAGFDGVIADVRLSVGESPLDYMRAVYENGREGGGLVAIGLVEARAAP